MNPNKSNSFKSTQTVAEVEERINALHMYVTNTTNTQLKCMQNDIKVVHTYIQIVYLQCTGNKHYLHVHQN